MRVITYQVILLEPTLVTALEGEPNSAVAFDYLPGSVLRGVVIDKYCQQHRVTDLATDQDARRLFFDGTTHYLNGYPLDRLDERTLPTPLSWQRKKGEESSLRDFAVQIPSGKEQWQAVSNPFCTVIEKEEENDPDVRLVQPDRHVSVHTARNRHFGRPRDPRNVPPGEDPGAVYRYDALAAGQTFAAAILCDNDADAKTLFPFLEGEATIGRSRSSGYGRVKFDKAKKEEAEWHEADHAFTSDDTGKFIVTLLSDALLRDPNGQYVVDEKVVTAMLSQKLGAPLRLYDNQAFLHGQEIGGFNRKWSLPLPQVLAVRMGSVFVYDPPTCTIDKIYELEAQGIGERRAEGFGRVAVNWHGAREMLQIDPTSQRLSDRTVTIADGPGKEIAQRMAERMLRQRLDEQLMARANRTAVISPPSNAQLSRLRNIIHHELMQDVPNTQRIGDFLENIRQRATARKQFERARVGSARLSEWLEQTRRKTNENEWQTLWGFDASQHIRAVGTVKPDLTDALRAEYILRFIDAVLAHAVKERRKEA